MCLPTFQFDDAMPRLITDVAIEVAARPILSFISNAPRKSMWNLDVTAVSPFQG
jgi:hypothetical protein